MASYQDRKVQNGDYWDRDDSEDVRVSAAARPERSAEASRTAPGRATMVLIAAIVLLLLVAIIGGWLLLSRMGISPFGGAGNSAPAANVVLAGAAGDLKATAGNAVSPGSPVDGVPTALIASRQVSPRATGTTDGVYLAISPEVAGSIAGKVVKITVTARAPAANPTAKFALAYSGTGANTGWMVFTPDTTFRPYNLNFRAPASSKAGPANIGIWSDISGQGRVLEVQKITVELAP